MKITKEKGITLIALVITIIVLLILAGVSIKILFGDNGLLQKAEKAKNENEKSTATETMNLKITNIQIQSYAENLKLPSLQYLADKLCEDNDIEYVAANSKRYASLDKIDTTNISSIYTKLKEYPYEFEINSSFQLASIDGAEIQSQTNSKSIIDESENILNFTPELSIKDAHFVKINVNVETKNEKQIKGYIYIINNEIKAMTESNEILVNLLFNEKYDVKVIAIDNELKGKISDIASIQTEKELCLFENGDCKIDTTGGYDAKFTIDSTYDIFTIEESILLSVPMSNNKAAVSTKNKIDLTNVNNIVFEVSGSSGISTLTNTIYVGVSNSNNPSIDYVKSKNVSGKSQIEKQYITVDVSDLNGEFYIKVLTHHGTEEKNYNTHAYIYSIYLK